MSCSSCGHDNPADSAFCENCGTRLVATCPGCGMESRAGARFCRGCGANLARPDKPQRNPVSARPAPQDNASSQPVTQSPSPSGAVACAAQIAHLDQATLQPPVVHGHKTPTQAQAGRRRLDAPMVGRKTELEEIAALLPQVIEERRGRVVELCGEPGSGKTRLLRELRHATSEQERGWVEVLLSEADQLAPLHVIVDLLHELLGLPHDLPNTAALSMLLARVLPAPECLPVATALRSILGYEGIGANLDASLRRRLLVRGLQQALTAEAGRRPLVVVLENVHWSDLSSLTVLRELAPLIAQLPVLLISSYQPPFDPAWTPAPADLRVELAGLTEQETAELLNLQLDGVIDLPAAAFLAERTAGNPLFLETLALILRRERYLEIDGEGVAHLPLRRYVLIPASLKELYSLQIDRLGENVRLALGPATVLGDPFTLQQLSELVSADRTWNVPATLLTSNLDHLLDQQFIEPLDEPETYRFRHSQTRILLGETIPALRASRLHTLQARRLEQESETAHGSRLYDLTYHYGLGDRAVKAVEYHARAAEHALAVQAYPEAFAHYQSALERLNELPLGQEKPALGAMLHAGLAAVRAELGECEAAEAEYRMALAVSPDPLVRADTWERLAALLVKQWRHQDALAELAREDAQLSENGVCRDRSGVQAAARFRLQRISLLQSLGWLADAEEVARAALQQLGADEPQRDATRDPEIQGLIAQICSNLGDILIDRRQFSDAAAVLQRAHALAGLLGDYRQLAHITGQLAHLDWLGGDLDAAAEHYVSSRNYQAERGDLRGAARTTHNLALVYWRQNKIGEAELSLLDALAALELVGEFEAVPAALANLERIYWYRGDYTRLHGLHERGQRLAAEADWDWTPVNALYEGRFAYEHGDWEEAQRSLIAALAASDKQQEEVALEASLWLGYALLASTRYDDAERVFAQALEIAQNHRLPASAGLLQLALAELALERGDGPGAAERIQAAAATADAPDQRQRLGSRFLHGRCQRVVAQLALKERRWSDADRAFGASVELLDECGANLEAARSRLAWAEALLERDAEAEPGESRPRTQSADLLASAQETFQASQLERELVRVSAALARL